MDSENESKVSSYSFELLDSEETSSEPLPIDCLITAIRQGNYAQCVNILNEGVNVNSRDSQGLTALHWAAINNRLDTIELLVSRLADVNCVDEHKKISPIHCAINHGCLRVVIYLASKCNADITLHTREGHNCLHLATLVSDTLLVAYFLERGVPVDGVDRNGYTPLHLACSRGASSDVVNLLLGYGANVNLTDSVDGNTPLHWAAICRNYAAANVLVDHGKCYLLATNVKGLTPLQLAESTNDIKFYKYLRDMLISRGVIPGDLSERVYLNRTARKWISLGIPPVTLLLLALSLAALNSVVFRAIFVTLTLSNSYHFTTLFCGNTEMKNYFFKSLFFSLSINHLIMWIIFHGTPFTILINILYFSVICYLASRVIKMSLPVLERHHKSLLYLIENNQMDSRDLCTVCLRRKARGMKHCDVCNQCVPLFECHCSWLGADLGFNNRRLYVALVCLLALWNTTTLICGLSAFFQSVSPEQSYLFAFFTLHYVHLNLLVVSASLSVYFVISSVRMARRILYGYDIRHLRRPSRLTWRRMLQNFCDYFNVRIFGVRPNYVDWTNYYGEEEYIV